VADFIPIGLRGVAFAATLQAAGIPIFLFLFEKNLDHAARPIRLLAVSSAVIGLFLTIGHTLVEPARLAGELRGIFDGSLQAMLLSSDSGTAAAVRVLGLGLVVGGWFKPSRFGALTALIGAALIVASFAFMGHTATSDFRWLLAPLLIVHLMVIAFWFGALWPLAAATRHERPELAGLLIEEFSRLAIRLVPILFLAGLVLSVVLLQSLSNLSTPYGILLLTKVAGFSILMMLAAANKWRFGPRIVGGDLVAVRSFRRTVLAEWVLIVGVVTVTATMTALYSPAH